MQRRFIVPALAAFVAMAAGSTSASAHDGYRDGYHMSRWYAAYERRREASDRRRLNAEERAYKRVMAHQDRLARLRDRADDYRERHARRWTEEASSRYRDYERYCDDCTRYRDYAHGPRVHGYYDGYGRSYSGYRHSYAHSYARYGHSYSGYGHYYPAYTSYAYGYPSQGYTYSTNGPPFTTYGEAQFAPSYGGLTDRLWRADDYPTGWSAWWSQMDRDGRTGQN